MTLPSPATSLDDNVQLARIRIFFGHASGNMASILVGAILIAVVLYSGGVSLPTATTIIPAGVYSIAALVRLSDVSGYRKYVDFKSRTSDKSACTCSTATSTSTTSPPAPARRSRTMPGAPS